MTANQLTAVRNAEIERNNRVLENLRDRELQENIRHSTVTERENERHQRATEFISLSDLAEKARSNRANESIGRTNASANTMNARSNQSNAITNARNAETNRLNAITNSFSARNDILRTGISVAQTREDIRHNKTVEKETARYQGALNSLSAEKNAIDAERNRINDWYNRQSIALSKGHLAVEEKNAETNRIRVYTDSGSAVINAIGKAAAMPQ